ncbi:TylF/MycF family methyltransferase [bacterium]|nr:TylF/MycF family methyltransferase [bacterium]
MDQSANQYPSGAEKSTTDFPSKADFGWYTASKTLQCSYCSKIIPKGKSYFWVAPMDTKRIGSLSAERSVSSFCPPGPYCHDYHAWKAEKSASDFQSKRHHAWYTAKKAHQCNYCGKTIQEGTRYLCVAPVDGKSIGNLLGKLSFSSLCPQGFYCHEYHAWKAARLVPELSLEDKYREAMLLLTKEYESKSLGDYLEFGVYHGTSMACMYRALKALELEHIRLFGFDSFEGLPDKAKTDDGGHWNPGGFKCDITFAKNLLTSRGVDLNRITLIKGWFSETLNNELVFKHNITKASVIMVDCDMYLSAKEALAFCEPLIQDAAIIFFDDWHTGGLAKKNMGEKRAFEEFLNENPQITTENLSQLRYSEWAEVFLVNRIH